MNYISSKLQVLKIIFIDHTQNEKQKVRHITEKKLRLHWLIHWYQFIYKTIIGKTFAYLCSLLNTSNSDCNLSSNYIILLIPKAHTSFDPFSLQFAAFSDWNQKLKLKTLTPFSSFTTSMRTIVCDGCSCF